MDAKREKFVKLTQTRMSRTLKAIRSVGNLGNHKALGTADVELVIAALDAEVAAVATKLKGAVAGEPQFALEV